MSKIKSTKEQLIIELAKLRNKVYSLEDENYDKRKMEKEISDLQKKLLHKKRAQTKLNCILKEVLLVDIDEINEILDEYEETNNSSLLTTATNKINESAKRIKETNGD